MLDVGHVGSLAPLIDMGVLKEPLHVDCVMGVVGWHPAHRCEPRRDGRQHPPEPPASHWGVIGISRDQWMLVGAALSLGGSIRVGLEDNLYLPNGEMARSNGELIAKARQMTEDVGRRPATVEEARAMLRSPSARSPRMSLPLAGDPRAGPLAAAARRVLLAAARGLRRGGAEGRGHRHGRLHPLVDADV